MPGGLLRLMGFRSESRGGLARWSNSSEYSVLYIELRLQKRDA